MLVAVDMRLVAAAVAVRDNTRQVLDEGIAALRHLVVLNYLLAYAGPWRRLFP